MSIGEADRPFQLQLHFISPAEELDALMLVGGMARQLASQLPSRNAGATRLHTRALPAIADGNLIVAAHTGGLARQPKLSRGAYSGECAPFARNRDRRFTPVFEITQRAAWSSSLRGAAFHWTKSSALSESMTR